MEEQNTPIAENQESEMQIPEVLEQEAQNLEISSPKAPMNTPATNETPIQKAKKPIFKRPIFIIGIGAALVALLIIILALPSHESHEHVWGEWQTKTAATCTENGTKARTCNDCGNVQTEVIYATGHSYGEWETETIATCQTNGLEFQICSGCGQKNTQTTYGNHQLNEDNICSVCNKNFISMTDAEKAVANEVHWIDERNVTYDKNNDWFKFTFALKDEDKYKLKVPTFVDLRIENDNAVVVYEKTILVKPSDYKNNLATIYIKSSEITADYIKNGDLYYKVYNYGYFVFAEYSLSVSNLPLKPITLILPSLPTTYNYYSDSSVKLTNISYEMNGDDLYIYLTGEKTYDKSGNSYSRDHAFAYKIYDSDGYVIKSGTLYTDSLRVGDKFKNEKLTLYGLEVGETYRLELLSVG